MQLMKMKPFKCLAAASLAFAVTAGTMLLSPANTYAASLPSPGTVFKDFNTAALVQNSSGTYYAGTLKSEGTDSAVWWQEATDISAAEDTYQRTHSITDWQLVHDLVTTFVTTEGTDWTGWITYNDDIGWMANAVLRGYQATGNTAWLALAQAQWDKAYNRGWSTNGGGGIWESQAKTEKCGLSNAPFVFTGVELYRATGDTSYLTKAEAIYSWMRSSMFNTSTGEVKHCVEFPNGVNGSTTLQGGEKAYDVGIFAESADALYRAVGTTQYQDDGVKALDDIAKTTPVTTSQYWLFRGLGEFCTDADDCGRYATFMNNNAADAWKESNSAGLTAIDWTTKTADTGLDPFALLGMVGLFQVLPSTTASPFSGTYKIENAGSKLALGVANDSSAQAAPVAQGVGSASQSWTLVPESAGYYEVRNSHSGQILNVTANSGKPGAAVIQYPAGGVRAGNDQWLPIQNADGTYSFYNRNSQLALDVTGASTSAGALVEQWAQNNGNAQKFILAR